MIKSLAKTIVVVASSTVLATLSVNAIDMSGVFSRSLLGMVFSSRDYTARECPENMVLVTQALVPFCIDMYEASPGLECPHAEPTNEDETTMNLAQKDCVAESSPNRKPWRYVSLAQAEEACSKAGKRLPSANEWYKAALGTPDLNDGWSEEYCNVSNNRADRAAETGSGMRCVSDAGAYDMVGNVWEWVEETINHGSWNGRELPSTGFVHGVDVDGIAYETESGKEEVFRNDRFWSDSTIIAGMMRGGFYNSAGQAGVFATYAASPPTFTGDAVGFRCAVTKL